MDEDGEGTEITSVLLSISVLNAIVLRTKKSSPLPAVLNKKAGFPFGSPAMIWFGFTVLREPGWLLLFRLSPRFRGWRF